jgi:hypothetical protein
MSSRYCASPVACSQNLPPDQTQKNKRNNPEKPWTLNAHTIVNK